MTALCDIILPQSARDLIGKTSEQDRHPGLQLDKLSLALDQKQQYEAIRKVCECQSDREGDRGGDGALLKALLERRRAVLDGLRASRFHGRTAGPLTLDLARANAMENAGLALHPVYGFAFLPGSGLKGLTRAFAKTSWEPCQSDRDTANARIDAAFGNPGAAGRIVFHDAWPVRWPRLECDIVNSHHLHYYKEGADKEPPGDWQEPVPVYFLAVAVDTEFEFAVSDRHDAGDGLCEQVASWMRAALEQAGAGAKTAAGYGRIVPCGPGSSAIRSDVRAPVVPPARLRCEHRLTLASPAFLAGAEQGEADCDLRPASLRGLLRWWWRTMHAHHVDTPDLARLEALIWGDTKRGSAISLSLRAGGGNKPPAPFDSKGIQRNSLRPKPQDRRTVQGLFYVSYGLDGSNSGTGRWYRRPGDFWDIVLSARETRWPANPGRDPANIPAALIMRQAQAALWLLARHGGTGSKSRKGFGSFEDVTVEGIDSIDDCIAAGRELREICGFAQEPGQATGTPALETRIGPVEIATPWRDPWFALDRVGTVYQRFVKGLEKQDRAVLGLPRKGGSTDDQRLASPAFWSLESGDRGLTVRLVSFPGNGAHDRQNSREVLKDLHDNAQRELPGQAARHGKTRAKAPSRRAPQPAPPPRALHSGQEVNAELLEERTKKGGWKARATDSGIAGNIQNSDDVPSDKKPGDRVRLIVQIPNPNNAAFKWPTPQVEEQLERSAKRNRKRRGRRG